MSFFEKIGTGDAAHRQRNGAHGQIHLRLQHIAYGVCHHTAIPFCAFGKIRILDRDEAREAAKILGAKYRPGFEEELAATVERNLDKMCVFALEIEHMTGKEAIELVRAKKQ